MIRQISGVAVARAVWCFVALAYVTVQLVVVSAWPVPYEFLHHTVSDLGWTECTTEQRPVGVLESCSPRHALFNAGTAVLSVLLAAGGVALRPVYSGRRRTWAILCLWVLIGASGVATALVPGNVDIALHSLLAIPLFLGQLLVLVLIATSTRRTAPVIAVSAAVAAAVSLAGSVGLGFALAGYGPVGLTERLSAETIYIWILLVALVGTGRQSPSGTPSAASFSASSSLGGR
ncbi:hypothetical protein F4561_005318 [Lipingzhangella halophila]|uniref:DUF998 domain-containing protein n=1 Tax=Lipingzhangella halophila TaxID=1783352 RepID=A0A7W7W5A3_9ACTN|nr:DUF998 domain-containing protein [Lipingzhangella halophila]MBB4934498.1 hypothetical protein [Lipingzhangella halophila]